MSVERIADKRPMPRPEISQRMIHTRWVYVLSPGSNQSERYPGRTMIHALTVIVTTSKY
jgi:hypothetical protein